MNPKGAYPLVRHSSPLAQTYERPGGIVGHMVVKDPIESRFYLKAGEVLGAGKQTVFGLGNYTFIPLKETIK